jgi:hypothetical protein
MSVRPLLLLLSLAAATAMAAPHGRKAPKPAPTPAPEDIDVDAMARAKDVDAGAAPATPESEPPATAAAQPSPAADASPAAPAAAAAEDPAAAAASEPPAASLPAPATSADPGAPATETAGVDEDTRRLVAICQAHATALLDAAQKGDYAGATRDFDAKMRGALPEPKFREAWESLQRFGALTARGQPHPMSGQGYIAITVPLLFEKANLYAQVACGSDGRVAGFYVKPLELPQP